MPMTVITLSKVPSSLRGDLTKWMQEIATGVYVGNFNAKVREELWHRVKDNLRGGEATISYKSRNELGYTFDIYNSNREKIDFDGIELVLYPRKVKKEKELKAGFSRAAAFQKKKKYSGIKPSREHAPRKGPSYIVLDIETEGLNNKNDHIIEIGAVKVTGNHLETLQMYVQTEHQLNPSIVALTGITNEKLSMEGIPLKVALERLLVFIQNNPIVGYCIDFDISFINAGLARLHQNKLKNQTLDLMELIKTEKTSLDNYKLQTVLKEYGINKKVPHRALQDAMLIYELGSKVNGFEARLKK